MFSAKIRNYFYKICSILHRCVIVIACYISDTLSDNYFHIALSSEMWISVQNGDKLGL